jgi:hypothetical protein
MFYGHLRLGSPIKNETHKYNFNWEHKNVWTFQKIDIFISSIKLSLALLETAFKDRA